MKKIINVIEYKKMQINLNEPTQTTPEITYSVYFSDDTITDYGQESVPDDVIDFIDFASYYDARYFSHNPDTKMSETIYFNHPANRI